MVNLMAGCTSASPTWRAKASALAGDLTRKGAPQYFPQEFRSFQDAFEHGEAIFHVQDKGIGIPESDLVKLFDSFYRASNVGTISGTGLGLAIVKRAVDSHGGKIGVESEVGVGTTFVVSLPLN